VTDATDLWVDIDGYLAPPGAGGLSLYSAQPFSGEKDVSVMGSGCGALSSRAGLRAQCDGGSARSAELSDAVAAGRNEPMRLIPDISAYFAP